MPTTTTIPVWTRGAAGNIRSSASLGASASSNANVNYDSAIEAIVHVNNTPGGTVAATCGLLVQIFRRYGTTPTTAATAEQTYTLPSAVPSTLESLEVHLGPGQYNIAVTNLDAANAITVEVTGDFYALQTS